jgi:hypothetical protein
MQDVQRWDRGTNARSKGTSDAVASEKLQSIRPARQQERAGWMKAVLQFMSGAP